MGRTAYSAGSLFCIFDGRAEERSYEGVKKYEFTEKYF